MPIAALFQDRHERTQRGGSLAPHPLNRITLFESSAPSRCKVFFERGDETPLTALCHALNIHLGEQLTRLLIDRYLPDV